MPVSSVKYRPKEFVRQDLGQRGVRTGWLTKRRLAQLPEPTYKAVVTLANAAAVKYGITRIKVDPLAKMSQVDLAELPLDLLIEGRLVRGTMLDLRGIEKFMQGHLAEEAKRQWLRRGQDVAASPARPVDQVRALVQFIKDESKYFEQLEEQPDATVGKLYKSLVHGLEKLKALGYHASIFRPHEADAALPDKCHWYEYYRAEKWGEGRYAKAGGAMPEGTLLTILRSPRSKFKVRLDDRDSFRRQNLYYSRLGVEYDLRESKGSPELLIFKVTGATEALQFVVYVNNRVRRDSFAEPPAALFPPEDAELIEEGLGLYFNRFGQALNKLLRREEKFSPVEKQEMSNLTAPEKKHLLKQGQRLAVQGENVRLFEAPSENRNFRQNPGLIRWLRQTIFAVYKGTSLVQGKGRKELTKMLSLEDKKMLERVVYCRYLALIEGDAPFEHKLKGLFSGTVMYVNDEGPGLVFKVPEAMIKKEARGKKLQVALSYNLVLRVFRKEWAERGFIRGFFHMVFKGLPFYATTQSLRVVRDMMRLKDLSVLRVVRGQGLTRGQRLVIQVGSEGKADAAGIERGAYGGRIAIDEEEKGITLRQPPWFCQLPVLSFIFRPYLRRLKREDERIKELFRQELGENGRFHIIGNFTIGVACKVGLELALHRLTRRRHS